TGGLDEMYTLTVDGHDIDIRISAQSTVDGGVSPAQEVPEPGTVLLLGCGLLGMVAVGRGLRRSRDERWVGRSAPPLDTPDHPSAGPRPVPRAFYVQRLTAPPRPSGDEAREEPVW